jgi:catechol 2,3-dioxygenase-like lactoylglutathione lyase family enzyme
MPGDDTSRIHHVTRVIPLALLDECVEFYALLGFVPANRPPSLAQRAFWLELGGTQLHLLYGDEKPSEGGHIAVLAPDYDNTVTRLSDAGHQVEARAQHWGAPRGYVRDPAGNLVELISRPPG